MTDKPNKNIPNNDNEIAPEGMNGSSLDLSRIAKEAVERKKLELLDDGDDETTSFSALSPKGDTTHDMRHAIREARLLEAERLRAEERAKSSQERVSTFTEGMRLKLTSDETPSSIIQLVQGELVVGRADNVTDYQPDIDLTPHGAYRLGLSRRHAIILREGDTILVKDLNSRNGTFINGNLVVNGSQELIHDGDDIRFGNLTMRVTFEN